MQVLLKLLRPLALFDSLAHISVLGVHAFGQLGEKLADALQLDAVEEAFGRGEDLHHLVGERKRFALALVERRHEAFAARERALRVDVEVGAELREGLEVAVLRELELDASCDLLHRRELRVAADAGDGDPDIDRRPHARVRRASARGRSGRR